MAERLISTDPLEFLSAYFDAPNDADIEMRGAYTELERNLLCLSVNERRFVLHLVTARKIADLMEDAMRKFPDDREAQQLPNLIMAIRAACDKIARRQEGGNKP